MSVQTYCFDLKEDMPLRNEDREWVADRIQAVVSEHLNPHGWRKAREFIPLAGMLGVFIGLLALAGSGWNYAFSRVDKEARFEQSTTDNLSRINEALKLIPAQIAVAQYSTIPPKELNAHRDELRKIKTTLASTKRDTPGFWPATFQLITLLSKATSPVEPQHAMLDLTDVSGIGARAFSYPPGSVIKLHKQIGDSVFTDAIIYLDSNVVLRNVTFINCTLVLPEIQTPPMPLEEIGNQLLSASDLSHITITGS
jgi:hypothetical protein